MKYFQTEELVCKHVYEVHEENAMRFLDMRLKVTIKLVRDILGVPMYVNNWKWGGSATQRGLRCNLCELVKSKDRPYLSAHVLGKGIDFTARGFTADEVRAIIQAHEQKFPYPIRLEKDVEWVHIDVMDMGNGRKINYF